MLVMKPSQILRQRYTSCLSGMGLTSTKKVGTQRGLLGWAHQRLMRMRRRNKKGLKKKDNGIILSLVFCDVSLLRPLIRLHDVAFTDGGLTHS